MNLDIYLCLGLFVIYWSELIEILILRCVELLVDLKYLHLEISHFILQLYLLLLLKLQITLELFILLF